MNNAPWSHLRPILKEVRLFMEQQREQRGQERSDKAKTQPISLAHGGEGEKQRPGSEQKSGTSYSESGRSIGIRKRVLEVPGERGKEGALQVSS